MKSYGTYSEWKKDQSAKNQKLITALERLIKDAAPLLTPTVKWGQGSWVSGKVPKIFMHTEPDHIQFGFYRGATLKDPKGMLVGKGKYVRHVKVHTLKDIDTPLFLDFIHQAVK